MATKLYIHDNDAFGTRTGISGGWHKDVRTAEGWTGSGGFIDGDLYTSTLGGAGTGIGAGTLNGPTAPIFFQEAVSLPLASGFTMSGTITFNIWADENSPNANAGLVASVYRLDALNERTLVVEVAKGTELPQVTPAAQNWTASGYSSVVFAKGDRILLEIGYDDAGGNMASGNNIDVIESGGTPGASGDTWVSFTETITFDETTPAGTTLYLSDADSSVNVGTIEKEAWTSRGSGATNATVNTVAGPIAPASLQMTASAGGTAIEWYTRPLQAQTISGPCLVHLRGFSETLNNQTASFVFEVALVNQDGSSPTVWSRWQIGLEGFYTTFSIDATQRSYLAKISGPDLSVANGQRLRFRVYVDDLWVAGNGALENGDTVTFAYAGGSGGDGDSYVTFSQSLTEYAPAALKRVYKRIVGPQQLGNTPGATLYTAPITGAAWIRHIHIINPTGADRTVTLSIGPDSAQTRVLDARRIVAGGMLDELKAAEHWLNAGEVIQANADAAAACVIVIDGIEFTL